jgi:hypothetical protein
MKGAVHRAESQCPGDGGAEKEKGLGTRRGKEKRKCVDEEEERARGLL